MRQANVLPHDYRVWLENLKTTIRSSQIKAALTVNSELIKLYWDLGKRIDEKVQHAQWGEGIIKHIAADLKTEFPNLTGFSRDNLYFMLRFYRFYQNETAIVEQLVQQIPWGHNILIFRKIKSVEAAVFICKQRFKTIGRAAFWIFKLIQSCMNGMDKQLPILIKRCQARKLNWQRKL